MHHSYLFNVIIGNVKKHPIDYDTLCKYNLAIRCLPYFITIENIKDMFNNIIKSFISKLEDEVIVYLDLEEKDADNIYNITYLLVINNFVYHTNCVKDLRLNLVYYIKNHLLHTRIYN